MIVTIDIEQPRMRVHLTPERATLVAHANGVPYRIEEYSLSEFIAHLRGKESPR